VQGNGSKTAVCVLGEEVEAAVQVYLAGRRTPCVNAYRGVSACTMESFCLSWGMPYVPATGRVCMRCSASCCWKCWCVCVSIRSGGVCAYTCVYVHVSFITFGVCAKRRGGKIIIPGGNSPHEMVRYR